MTMDYDTPRAIFHEIVKKINNNSLQLASLPAVIVKVNEVLNDDRKGMSDIAKVVQNEIALSARIIQIANSPALRGAREINSINDAINRLGIDLVKNLAICVSLKDKFNTKNMMHKDLMVEQMHISNRRSIYGFMIAKHLATGLHPEISLISGLVSKIGQVVIIRFIDDHNEYKTLSADEVRQITDEFGDEVGDLILRRWEFPTTVIDAVFGRDIGNTAAPTTYRDIYVLTDAYLEYLNIIPRQHPMYSEVDFLIANNQEDFQSLELIFS